MSLSRRDELLADSALAWIDDGERGALADLLCEPEARARHAELERTAALAALAFWEPVRELRPCDVGRLTTKLQADALRFFAGRVAQAGPMPGAPGMRRLTRALPWLVAAACLLLLLPRLGGTAPDSPAVARAALLREASVLRCDWQPGPSARRGQVSGDVVWSAARQEGYLSLRGLPLLDAEHRYQLWIVDAARSGPPVDGGLLALPQSEREAVVRVSARLPVRNAAAFVLTIEAAEGAVVSAQQHVVAVAKP